MYKVIKRYYKGYVILPVFKVKVLVGGYDAEFTCSDFWVMIFSIFFSWFWNGRIFLTGEYLDTAGEISNEVDYSVVDSIRKRRY